MGRDTSGVYALRCHSEDATRSHGRRHVTGTVEIAGPRRGLAGGTQRLMGRLVKATQDAISAVTSAMAAGEDRPGQRHMAAAIAQAIEDGRHLLVKAGTGTGKTIAYLVPVLLSGRRAVVATATLALQDQLVQHDLPLVAAALEREYTCAVLKGRSNYVCLQRVSEALAAPDELDLGPDRAGTVRDEVRQLVAWTATARTGDRAELSFEPSPSAWAAVSVGSRECPGAARCPQGGPCFAERARRAAAEAQIVVVNTHLYGAHLASGGVVLPEHDVVVIDEAHVFEAVVSATAGVELTGGRIRAFRSATTSVLTGVEADRLATDLDHAADRLRAWLCEHEGRALALPVDRQLADVLGSTRLRIDNARRLLGELPGELAAEVAGRKLRALQASVSLLNDVDQVLAYQGGGEVAWVEGSGSANNPTRRLAPIDVGPAWQKGLWDKPAVILTSATLPLATAKQLGVPADRYETLDVGSPFDYPNQALLYCASHLPDPRQDGYEDQLIEEIERLVVAAGGRTLALFTSWKRMQTATAALRPRLPWTVLAQGDLPKPALLERFGGDETSCLFATTSFWQGVDVPGAALSLVTIDRLPFPRPDDPLAQARRDAAAPRGFGAVDLPHAATLLAQAAGRLIRTRTDRGVVAVLDRRLATARNYRWDLINALPPMRRTKDRAEAEEFLRSIRDARPKSSPRS